MKHIQTIAGKNIKLLVKYENPFTRKEHMMAYVFSNLEESVRDKLKINDFEFAAHAFDFLKNNADAVGIVGHMIAKYPLISNEMAIVTVEYIT